MKRAFLLFLIMILLFSACSSVSPYARKGEIALYSGNFEEAVKYYEQAVRQDPRNPYYRSSLYRARMAAVVFYWKKAEKALAKGEKDKALQFYRKALKYDPTNEALLRKVKELEKESKKLTQEIKIRKKKKIKVSLSFTNTSLKTIFKALGKYAGVNFVFDEAFVDKPFSIFVEDMDFEKVLHLLCASTQNFYHQIDENNYLIVPDLPSKRQQYISQKIRVFFLKYASVKRIRSVLLSIVRGEAIFSFDEDLNAIIVRGEKKDVDLVEKLLKKLDKPRGEVLIQVEVLEVDRTKLLQMGLDFSEYAVGATLTAEGEEGTSSLPTLHDLSNLTSRDLIMLVPTAYLRFLETATESRIMAQPTIRGIDGEKVVFKVGERVPVPRTTFAPIAAGGLATQPVTSYEYQDVGLIVEMEPEINSSKEVTLSLKLNVSSISGTGYNNLPKFGNREINMKLRVKEGETVIIAGLLKNERRETLKGPSFLRSIPVIGWLLSNIYREETQVDVVLALTPYIVSYPEITEEDLKEITVGKEAVESSFPESVGVKPIYRPARAGNTVNFLPSAVSRGKEEKFSLSVILRMRKPISSGDIVIRFDPNFLQVDRVNKGAALIARKGIFSSQTGDGTITLSFNLPPNKRMTAGQIAYIVFKAIEAGRTSVSFLSVNLRDENQVPVSVKAGQACEIKIE